MTQFETSSPGDSAFERLRPAIPETQLPETAATEAIDGVHRYPHTGITVVIIGAGLGGLLAALECWRKGHEVCIVERNQQVSTVGDGVSIAPSALATLHKYPRMLKEYNSRVWDARFSWRTISGELLLEKDPEWLQPGKPHVAKGAQMSLLKTRPEFVQMLFDQTERLGIPIYWGFNIVSYEEKAEVEVAYAVAESGEIFPGNVVIAADGIGTKSHSAIGGHNFEAKSSGFAIARAGFSPKDLTPGSKASSLIPGENERPTFRMYLAHEMHLVLFLARGFIAFGLTHADSTVAKESWHHTINSEEIVKVMESKGQWDEAVIDLVRQCPEGRAVHWPLKWRDPQPTWASQKGRLVQLGDAAHAFLPTSGNGATQALEDALTLSECLRIGGKDRVHWSTKVYQTLRYQRTSVIQRTGFVNRLALHHFDLDKRDQQPALENLGKSLSFGKWMWTHHAEKYATDNYEQALAHLQSGAPFENTNLPKGHIFEEWTMETEMAREKAGIPSTLKSNGDWSADF